MSKKNKKKKKKDPKLAQLIAGLQPHEGERPHAAQTKGLQEPPLWYSTCNIKFNKKLANVSMLSNQTRNKQFVCSLSGSQLMWQIYLYLLGPTGKIQHLNLIPKF